MILVRDIFQLKFGKAREAVSVWKEGMSMAKRSGNMRNSRLLTDLVGPYYTLVLESSYDSLTDYEQDVKQIMSDKNWQCWYERFLPLAEGGRREIFNILE